MLRNILYLLMGILYLVSCKTQENMNDKTVVKQFDTHKYLGKWYEIARYDHRFERNLVGVTATYTLRKDGKIKVENAGFKKSLSGRKSVATGKAKIPNPQEPAKLKVSFFWFFYGDYYVMELDENYQWAVIGSSSDKYLWILSRSPKMEDSLYNQILKKLSNRGYNINKLIKVKQKDVE